MAITVVPKSDTFTITTRPSVNKPAVSGTDMTFSSNNIVLNGACQITGDPGDDPAGWTLGIIQLQWIETNWGEYRGETNTDGSTFLQRARPPSRPAQACRDTLAKAGILVDNDAGHDRTVATKGAKFPFPMTARLTDHPGDAYPLTRINVAAGKKLNFLHEVQLEFHFCSVLTLMSPKGVFHHLKSVYWNMHWQATFRPKKFAVGADYDIVVSKAKGANAANVGGIINGNPTDKRFKDIITKAGAPNCNQVATDAASKPNVQEKKTWESFDVRR